MEKLGLNEIRERFLTFFESKNHLRLKSHSLVPENDNSLLLISAGMAPLKPYFTGELTPPAPRAASCQKCIRLKDIENVGRYARYGTYFEMLGNFSFGDYFKRDAQKWAWEFCTQVLELPIDRLHVSVYLDDDEAYDIWKDEIGVDPTHIVRLGKEDNFWEIGVGPCGPCSEVYFDRGPDPKCTNPSCAVGCDCDRYVEFWNLVFTQFFHDGNGNYELLEKKNIDTGMGLERIACIMQEVDTLFEVDTIARIREAVCTATGAVYHEDDNRDVSIRIITDHIRSSAFMISDGIMPSNVGRGYVLRRLIRSAARHGRLLGRTDPFLHELLDVVIQENQGAYPELREKEAFIRSVISAEEERFGGTIEAGLKKLDEMIAKLSPGQKLSGEDAFRLYDTDGFPIDMTVDILAEQGLEADIVAFEALMDKQRKQAKSARGNTAELGWEGDEVSLKEYPETLFTGYEQNACKGKLLAIISGGELTDLASEGDQVTLVFDRTPFYAESGGQVADTGTVTAAGGSVEITGVKKTADGKYLHVGRVTAGEITKGAQPDLAIDAARRDAIRRAHSATHLLHKALRSVLGDHVEQSGSLVEPDGLRFDFSHFAAMTTEEIFAVEDQVNRAILDGLDIRVDEMPADEAKKLGAMALFGEKYGDTVRVVRMGDYSMELCGGTHLNNTARIGLFKIGGEASVAAGIRRIEAVCGLVSLETLREREGAIALAAATLKTKPADLNRRIGQVMDELRQESRAKEMLEARLSRLQAAELLNESKMVGDLSVLAVKVEAETMDALRSLSDSLREKNPSLVSVLAAVNGDKVQLAAACGKDAVAKGAHAGNLVKQVAQICGGSGGGKPDSATAGGKNPGKVQEALDAVPGFVEAMLK